MRHIKGVQRLPHLMQYKIRNVHHVVNRAKADSFKPLLQPLRRFLYLHALYGNARITRAGFRILNGYPNALSVALTERVGGGQLRLHSQHRRQVARHAKVRGRIDAVGGKPYFEYRVGFHMQHVA